MNKNRGKLIQDIFEETQNLEYTNNKKLDFFLKKVDRYLSALYGPNNFYLKDFRSCVYNHTPMISGITSASEEVCSTLWNAVRPILVNNFTLMLEEIKTLENIETEKKDESTVYSKDEIFIVHKQRDAMKDSISRFINLLELKPIVLNEQVDSGKTFIEKFLHYSNVGYAIILITPEEIVWEKNIDNEFSNFQASQDVIFQLGYFVGKLGRDRVFIIYDDDNIDKPKFKLPSDLSGIIYTSFQNEVWKNKLAKELKQCNYKIRLESLIDF